MYTDYEGNIIIKEDGKEIYLPLYSKISAYKSFEKRETGRIISGDKLLEDLVYQRDTELVRDYEVWSLLTYEH